MPAYEQYLPISKAKKKDLLQLCRKNIIPTELHGWYESLPASDNIEPNIISSESDDCL
jgi:hypothetical protein